MKQWIIVYNCVLSGLSAFVSTGSDGKRRGRIVKRRGGRRTVLCLKPICEKTGLSPETANLSLFYYLGGMNCEKQAEHSTQKEIVIAAGPHHGAVGRRDDGLDVPRA